MEYRDTVGVTKLLCGSMKLEVYNPLIEKPTTPLYTHDIQVLQVTIN
jgi:hypothetical protein